MAYWASILGAGLGGFFGGIPGAIAGAALGSMVPGGGNDSGSELPIDLTYLDEKDGRQLRIEPQIRLGEDAVFVLHAYREDGETISGLGSYRDDDGDFSAFATHDPASGGAFLFIPSGALDAREGEQVVLRITVLEGNDMIGSAQFVGEWMRGMPFSELHRLRPLLDLAAWTTAADGPASSGEIEFLNGWFLETFELDRAVEFELRTQLSRPGALDLEWAVDALEVRMPWIDPATLLEFLVDVAACDGKPNARETEFLRGVALALGLSPDEWPEVAVELGLAFDESRLRAAYEVLGVPSGAPLQEVKAAYRRLMREYHPDMLATLPKAIQDLATEKTLEVRAAYDLLTQTLMPKAG